MKGPQLWNSVDAYKIRDLQIVNVKSAFRSILIDQHCSANLCLSGLMLSVRYMNESYVNLYFYLID